MQTEEIKKSFEPNERQQEAIKTIDGPVMLLAGPGTGKTYTLIKRVERMLSLGISPESILCLTFSEAATSEMSKRLLENIGLQASGVSVSTYHGFCNEIIRQNPMEFELIDDFQMADDVTKQTILKESIDEYSKSKEINFLKDKWGNKYFYISSILNGISVIKRERTTKEEFFDYIETNEEWEPLLKEKYEIKAENEQKKGKITKKLLNEIEAIEKKIGKAKEFYEIFEIYKKKLSENNLIDYSDMINLVLDKFEEDKGFLENAVKKYKYVLVDEYQDTNKVQNEIIFNILEGANTNNIFVVGDDDQIIYSFQGARCSNLEDFIAHFPAVKIIRLEENRRSTQTVLDIAEELIKDDELRLTNNPKFNIEKKLIAKNEKVISKETKADFNIYQDKIQENNEIIEQIKGLLEKGVKYSEIAVLGRKNDYLEDIARLLKQNNIPYELSKKQDAFDFPSFLVLYFYLKLLTNSYIQQDKLFGILSNEPFKITEKTLADILKKSRITSKTISELVFEANEDNYKEDEKFQTFLKIFKELKAKKSFIKLVPFVHEVAAKTGILGFYANNSEERFENILAIKRLIEEARSYSILHKGAYLEEFLSHLDSYFKENIRLELQNSELSNNAVKLLTYHGSKGREFEHVFMPNLTARAFENAKTSNKEIKLPIAKSLFSTNPDTNLDAEILRLLFVGITRAKFGLHLSYSNSQSGSPETCSKYITALFPKYDYMFEKNIFELDKDKMVQEIKKDINVLTFGEELNLELRQRLNKIVISQTSLNRYLNCPLQYLYSDILKIPVYKEDVDVLAYGSAMHYSIDVLTKNAIKEKNWGSKEKMVEIFLKKIEEYEFSNPLKKLEFIERGRSSILKNHGYLVEASLNHILATEYKMELEYKGAILKGFADRITVDNTGGILITDFKTGSRKNVNSNENYFNQLCFYKFLYESLNPDKKVISTSLTFFEEGCKTSSVKDLKDNNDEIEHIVSDVIERINNLEFEPKKDKEVCKFCNYKLLCKFNS